jgi:hypothetical protein
MVCCNIYNTTFMSEINVTKMEQPRCNNSIYVHDLDINCTQ